MYPDLGVFEVSSHKVSEPNQPAVLAVEIKWCRGQSMFTRDAKTNLFQDLKKLRVLVETGAAMFGMLVYGFSNPALSAASVGLSNEDTGVVRVVPVDFTELKAP